MRVIGPMTYPIGNGGTGPAHFVATLAVVSGPTYVFDSNTAIDQGTYNGPYVQQKSLMVQLAGCPYTVFFRPDTNGLRDEVVVELGKMWSGTPFQNTTGYSFSVTKNGSPLFSTTLPYHWWWSRWRWQSSVRPFVRTAASLIADKHFLPYTSSYLYGYTAWSTNYTYTPMGLAGLISGQGATGDRPEIGPLTTPQSDYILLGTTLAKNSMLAQAEASGTMPCHYRDENTGQWFDNQAYPYYGVSSAGPPTNQLPSAAVPQVGGNPDPNYIRMDLAHVPSLCYAPYLFTDDPYYLEEIQAVALYGIVESNYYQYGMGLPGLQDPIETRGTAWGCRNNAMAVIATPSSVPSWINSKAHWQTNFDDNYTYCQRFVTSPSKMSTVFNGFGRTDLLGSFQMDYAGICFAWIARMFPATGWPAVYQWIMGGIMPLVTGTNGSTGWIKGWPDPYYYTVFFQNQPSYTFYFSTTASDGDMANDWAGAWSLYCSTQGGPIGGGTETGLTTCPNPTWNGSSIVQTSGGQGMAVTTGYVIWRQNMLHLAQGLGVIGAAAAVTWIDTQAASLVAANPPVTNDPRFSFDTTS